MTRFSVHAPRYGLPLALGLSACLVVYGRFIVQAGTSVRAARVAAANGDFAEATRAYLDALRAYVPGSPFERQALDGLDQLAAGARAAGDHARERRAWEAMRAGLLGTRSLYTPYPTRFIEATRRLEELDATAAFPAAVPEMALVSSRGNGPGRSVRPLGPAVVSTLVALVGFAAWVGSIVLLIRRGLERNPRRTPSDPAVARLLLPALFVVGFALFLVGLRFS